jgi:hypothetical protein
VGEVFVFSFCFFLNVTGNELVVKIKVSAGCYGNLSIYILINPHFVL